MEQGLVTEDGEKDLEGKEFSEILADLRARFDLGTIRAVMKMHSMLGHPSPKALATSLELMQAQESWVKCARLYQCEDCLKRQRPKAVRVATLPRAKTFNETVDTDNFHILWKNERRGSSTRSWTSTADSR